MAEKPVRDRIHSIKMRGGGWALDLNDVVREILLDWMRTHDVSENALAKRLGVSQSNINRFFGGDAGINLETLSLICTLDGLAPDTLFDRHPIFESRRNRKRETDSLLRRLASLVPEDRLSEVVHCWEVASTRGVSAILADLTSQVGKLLAQAPQRTKSA